MNEKIKQLATLLASQRNETNTSGQIAYFASIIRKELADVFEKAQKYDELLENLKNSKFK